MRKLIFASISTVALLALAACDGGTQAPESGDQMGTTTTTTPAPADPAGGAGGGTTTTPQ